METPSLRLKFTPLLTNAVVDTAKCCLEIVPEVTCVQNLDKISWKQDNELVEYTIPMTYKIIIKKREDLPKTDAKSEDKLEKTYYSCVELRPDTSMSFVLAPCHCDGDVAKILSDTILHTISSKSFFCKSLTNVQKRNCTKITQSECHVEPIAVLNKDNMPIIRNKISEEPIVHEILSSNERVKKDYDYYTDLTSYPVHLTTAKHMELSSILVAIEENNPNAEDEIVNSYIDKITSTEKIVKKTQSVETLTDISANSDEPKKLTLTPICSINTNNLRFHDNALQPLTYVVNHVFECVPKDLVNVASRLPTRNKKQFDLRTMHEWDDWSNKKSVCTARKRVLPEERVANFIKKMETEIMPLKLLLNEIIHKCSTLNLPKLHKSKHGNVMLYATVPNPKDKSKEEKKSISKALTDSNRVVYSIVFDG